jgi:hypothetical protein
VSIVDDDVLVDIIGEGIKVVDPEMERQRAVDGEWLMDELEDTLEVVVGVFEA